MLIQQKYYELHADASRHGMGSVLYQEYDGHLLQDRVVYRRVPSDNPEGECQLFLSEKYRETILITLHYDHGHLGSESFFKLVRHWLNWPPKWAEVESYCHILPSKAAPLGHLQSQGPMELVCIDFLCLEPDLNGQGNHFPCYAQAFPTKDQRPST